ncbi:RNA polymerase sigma-70 factor [Chitinophaga japonensis]|uniref:RNA polymerase sigma-70 factor (ECF subfamily) n=1 Tax=Chitinophaga japonensis TaxID=104662 RepID=A0A562T566_CHIJA|nr:RNA polymerase sigma-70 factor [Chitinophaga japonensis]TWI88206.1 RNA polymerase sigma-70 factor (ECF subfamily) [Chitinophaga japonensis]
MSDNPSKVLFQQIFENNHDKVFRFAYKLTGDVTRAQEITQQCFIRLWENIHKVQEGQDVFPLLFVFTKHIVVDEVRKLYREKQTLAQMSAQQPAPAADNPDEQKLLRKEFRQQIQKVIEKMPEQRRNVYLLSRDKGHSHREIAEQLRLSPATVRNHLNLALQFIRREMMAYYDMEIK